MHFNFGDKDKEKTFFFFSFLFCLYCIYLLPLSLILKPLKGNPPLQNWTWHNLSDITYETQATPPASLNIQFVSDVLVFPSIYPLAVFCCNNLYICLTFLPVSTIKIEHHHTLILLFQQDCWVRVQLATLLPALNSCGLLFPFHPLN